MFSHMFREAEGAESRTIPEPHGNDVELLPERKPSPGPDRKRKRRRRRGNKTGTTTVGMDEANKDNRSAGVAGRKRAVTDFEQVERKRAVGPGGGKETATVATTRKVPSQQRIKSRPTEAALALSESLKKLSSKKRLREALDLYWSRSSDSVRDGHHGSIIVDCCARCGNIEEGEKVVRVMKEAGTQVSVHANTALMKGYVHSGMIGKGANLYRSMWKAQDPRDRPNVRTLNTLLRGCLWTAAAAIKQKSRDDNTKSVANTSKCTIAGGVMTSEEAWALSSSRGRGGGKKREARLFEFDCSSYEYSIALLCQAIRCKDAEKRIEEMKRVFVNRSGDKQLSADFAGCDRTVLESLAVSLVSLARAYALRGKVDKARCIASESLLTIERASGGELHNRNNTNMSSKASAAGGKRAWRQQESTIQSGKDCSFSRRSVSNVLFRDHRLSELRLEAECIDKLCRRRLVFADSTLLAQYMITRLLYFSGGGTTGWSNTQGYDTLGDADVEAQLITSLWLSFGLPAALSKAVVDSFDWKENGPSDVAMRAHAALCKSIAGYESNNIIGDDGFLDFSKIFSPLRSSLDQNDPSGPLNIELGAGSGDWITLQAKLRPNHNFVSVELRADRVSQTFSKGMLNTTDDGSHCPLSNLCCVGSEGGSFLRNRIKPGSVTAVYVNHPEPPTQTYGSHHSDLSSLSLGINEPAHMLNSDTLLAAARCLKRGRKGKLVIVTDNRSYARLICTTLHKTMSKNKGLLEQMDLSGGGCLQQLEVFGGGNNRDSSRVTLYEGQPSMAIGHYVPNCRKAAERGLSYFDRLWRTGAGSHAEMKKRFIVVAQTCEDGKGTLSRGENEKGQKSLERQGARHKQAAKKKPNKKRSAAKQQRRNQRRLVKKLQEFSR